MARADGDVVLMELAPSPPRRAFAIGVLYALGLLLAGLAVSGALAPLSAVALGAAGGVALWVGERLRRATADVLRLTGRGLADGRGRLLAAWDEIERVERGALAFKPSNGFVLILNRRAPAAWAPGLWWRLGRRLGVGGVTHGAATRALAERIALGPRL